MMLCDDKQCYKCKNASKKMNTRNRCKKKHPNTNSHTKHEQMSTCTWYVNSKTELEAENYRLTVWDFQHLYRYQTYTRIYSTFANANGSG